MRKKISITALIIGVLIVISIAAFPQSQTADEPLEKNLEEIQTKIVMPSKSSRPGCEETDLCYIPSVVTISPHQSVTWVNQDVAFHTVTSGQYGNPDGLFDSNHLDPGELFSVTFDKEGIYEYHCTLHPWMKGKVIVGS